MIETNRIKIIDLFAGCGGLMDGFEQSNLYQTIAAVEWEKAPCINLIQRLKDKWNYKDADKKVLRFDIQRTDELFKGWKDDNLYGSSEGLDRLVQEANGIDIIIGGPPCQAYSIAGRIRDEHGMRLDYRNFLFESYLRVVKKYKPLLFVFENVPGLLSAKPYGKPIVNTIYDEFNKAGYTILKNLNNAVIDFTEYGVPQRRNRMVIIGVSKEHFGKEKSLEMVNAFYDEILPKNKVKKKKTVRDAIGDLPPLYPLENEIQFERKKISHSLPKPFINNHISRWHSKRDMEIFRLLAHDIESGRNEYVSTEALKKLYTEKTGKTSNIHKYYVIRWDEQSNLIPAHLFKDGLRHIHPDPKQSRTITVREAARLQTFDDDYDFIGSNMETYKMIGNAVPPCFAKCLAEAVYELLMRFKDKDKTYEECRINNQNVQISISSKRGCENMKYYLKKCGHQELGSVNANGKAQRGRYLLTSMNTDVLSMFPPLSTAQMNDSALLPIIPLYSGKKVYCNYVYHNDKFHGSSAKHPRNEYRLYLNKAIEENRLLFKTDDIIIIRPQTITAESNDETDETIYYLDYVQYGSSELYRYLNDIISTYPINGGYGLYEGVIDEFEEKVSHIANPNDCEVEIDDTVMKKVTSEQNPIAELFTAASFRDFVMVGYENLCAITNTVIRYGSYMNLEAAHIRPKSHGGLFLPNNGMALCRDLHWAFDKGFFTLDDNYRVIVHPKTSSEYLQQFDKKQIRLPKNNFFIPDLENIKYHQNNVYGLFLTTGRL